MGMTAKQLAANAVNPPKIVRAFDKANLPIKVALWYVLIAPVKPKSMSDGGIEIPEEAKQAENYLVSIGEILDMGDFAYKSKTQSGLDLSTDSRKPSIGDFVLFQQYAGTRMVMRDGRQLLILTDTEIIGVVPPERVSQVKFYL